MKIFAYIFLGSILVAEAIRYPHKMRQKRRWGTELMVENRMDAIEVSLLTLSFFALYILPVLSVFSAWLSFADYEMLQPVPYLGLIFLIAGMIILWRAHHDLGSNWASTMVVWNEQGVVDTGIYKFIRHPIYLAMWLMVIAQALMLPNWMAGLAGIAVFFPIYLYRAPREEQLMLDHFGEKYRNYMQRSGRLLPRLRG